MYVHIGEKKIISFKNTIGIFNYKVLSNSRDNDYFLSIVNNDLKNDQKNDQKSNFNLKDNHKAVIIFVDNSIQFSSINSQTLIKRNINKNDIIWSINNDK